MEPKDLKTQKISEGYGPKYHRIYSIVLPLSLAKAKKGMLDLQADLDQCSPALLATFEKVEGKTRRLKPGDEFQIHIAGPWDGPVRVTHAEPLEFKLVTLQGHLEAGEINFRLKELNPKQTLFEIESLARSRDIIVDFFYDKVPLAKIAQTQMWTSFCKSFAERTLELHQMEKDHVAEVNIYTEKYDEESKTWRIL